MRDFFRRFFSNKFNIALSIIQVLAVLFFVLVNVWDIMLIFAIVTEGVFFVMLGISTLFNNKTIKDQESLFERLPIGKADIESIEKTNKRKIKSNKFQAVLCIFLGIVLIFLIFI